MQLLSVEIPAEYGGTEASFMSLCLTIEELSKVDAGVGLLCDLQNTVVNNVFLVGLPFIHLTDARITGLYQSVWLANTHRVL